MRIRTTRRGTWARLGLPIVVLLAASAMAIGLVMLVGVPVTAAQTTVGAKQHFIGAVDGQAGLAVVTTVCPGPERIGELGPLLGGQAFLVVETPKSGGDTGLFTTIYAWFVPPSGGSAPVQVKLTGYGAPVPIPSSVRVPCSGTGRVAFSSCPYLAPCAAGWTPTYVHVKFEDIAV